jgi:hypothetical protein
LLPLTKLVHVLKAVAVEDQAAAVAVVDGVVSIVVAVAAENADPINLLL